MAEKFSEPFTRIANRISQSPLLDPFDKAVLLAISSVTPSFPSYQKLMEWTGISKARISKSIKNLESRKIITTYRVGRHNQYVTFWNSIPDELVGIKPVHHVNYISSPDEPYQSTP